ncbi:hypothetical protein B0H19DRAFT_1308123 [Mycena capillaripes]|nr:hypothetical protein B0H19DRAFT_1308123 [Mycena capillaripes]
MQLSAGASACRQARIYNAGKFALREFVPLFDQPRYLLNLVSSFAIFQHNAESGSGDVIIRTLVKARATSSKAWLKLCSPQIQLLLPQEYYLNTGFGCLLLCEEKTAPPPDSKSDLYPSHPQCRGRSAPAESARGVAVLERPSLAECREVVDRGRVGSGVKEQGKEMDREMERRWRKGKVEGTAKSRRGRRKVEGGTWEGGKYRWRRRTRDDEGEAEQYQERESSVAVGEGDAGRERVDAK